MPKFSLKGMEPQKSTSGAFAMAFKKPPYWVKSNLIKHRFRGAIFSYFFFGSQVQRDGASLTLVVQISSFILRRDNLRGCGPLRYGGGRH